MQFRDFLERINLPFSKSKFYDLNFSNRRFRENVEEGNVECNFLRQTGRTTDLILAGLWAMLFLDERVIIYYHHRDMAYVASKKAHKILFDFLNEFPLDKTISVNNVLSLETQEGGSLTFASVGNNIVHRGTDKFVFYDNAIFDIVNMDKEYHNKIHGK